MRKKTTAPRAGGRDRVKEVFPAPKPKCQAARAREVVAEQVAKGCAVPRRTRARHLLKKLEICAEFLPSRAREMMTNADIAQKLRAASHGPRAGTVNDLPAVDHRAHGCDTAFIIKRFDDGPCQSDGLKPYQLPTA